MPKCVIVQSKHAISASYPHCGCCLACLCSIPSAFLALMPSALAHSSRGIGLGGRFDDMLRECGGYFGMERLGCGLFGSGQAVAVGLFTFPPGFYPGRLEGLNFPPGYEMARSVRGGLAIPARAIQVYGTEVGSGHPLPIDGSPHGITHEVDSESD